MRQINQTTEVAYSCIDFQDAVVMLPVMDELAKRYQQEVEWLEKHNEDTDRWVGDHIERLVKVGNQLKVLSKLGFCPSAPGMIQSCEWFKF